MRFQEKAAAPAELSPEEIEKQKKAKLKKAADTGLTQIGTCMDLQPVGSQGGRQARCGDRRRCGGGANRSTDTCHKVIALTTLDPICLDLVQLLGRDIHRPFFCG